jgi:DNA-directed RNA polymerase subunit beta'
MKKKLILNNNKTFNKNEVKKLIEWFINTYGAIRTTKLLDKIKTLGFKYISKAGISLGTTDLKIPNIKKNLIKNTEKDIKKAKNNYKGGKKNLEHYSKIINESWNKTNEILKAEIIKNFEQTDLLNPVYMMIISGARGNISQIKQLVGMRGLIVDSQGEIINSTIKNNLKEGLRIPEYFISCYGARKGIIDTSIKTANSGYLTRRLIYTCGHLLIKKSNCNSKKSELIIISKKKRNYFLQTMEKIVGRILAKDIWLKTEKKKLFIPIGQDLCKYLAKKILNCKKIYLRSPLTCKLNVGLCQLCYGWNLANGRLVELGESVGIIAAQSIGEPGTQLTMRTFHTGGIFTSKINQIINATHKGKIFYNTKKGGKIIETKFKEKAFFTLQSKKILLINNRIKKSIINVPKYSIIFVKNKEKVHIKQTICEISNWKFLKNLDPRKSKKKDITATKTNISGLINFNKKNKNKKNTIWIIQANILNYYKITKIMHKNIQKNKIKNKLLNTQKDNTKPNFIKNTKIKIKLNNKKIKKLINFTKKNIKKEKDNEKINYNVKRVSIKEKTLILNKLKSKLFCKKPIKKTKIGTFLKSKKIKNNLKNSQILEKQKKGLIFIKTNPYLTPIDFKSTIGNQDFVKKKRTLFFSESYKQKIKDIVEGLPQIEEILEATNKKPLKKNIHTKTKNIFKKFRKKYKTNIAAKKAIEKIQKYLVRKIKNVYSSQGVKISEKHFQIIIKQMTSKVIIKKEGDSNLINGEIIDLNKIEKINKHIINKVFYEPIVIGISKISILNNSFLSAASFQETRKVLTKAVIENKIDWLQGLKENIILGNIIPAGTGFKQNI